MARRTYTIARALTLIAFLSACSTPMVNQDNVTKWYPNFDYHQSLTVLELEEQAEAGSRDAHLELALRLISGNGVARDESRAVQIFSDLSDLDDPRAQYFLGAAYIQGAGVEKNEVKSLALLRESAKSGYAMGQFWYGFMLSRGLGVPQADWQEALVWFHKAGDQGHIKAQFSMGEALASCRGGISPDFEKAATWYRKAIDQGDMVARYNLERLIVTGLVNWRDGDPGSPPLEIEVFDNSHCGDALRNAT